MQAQRSPPRRVSENVRHVRRASSAKTTSVKTSVRTAAGPPASGWAGTSAGSANTPVKLNSPVPSSSTRVFAVARPVLMITGPFTPAGAGWMCAPTIVVPGG